MSNEKEVSDELLAEAATYANEVLDVDPCDDESASDVDAARAALQFDDAHIDQGAAWALLIIGYVEVARRGGWK